MKMVSIIVPVYNSEAYLDDAIDSLVKQSYSELEIILIDDGSKDGSGFICDKWVGIDQRVIVIHQENGGICAARNTGIKNSRGDYLMFCDNDDYYYPDAVKNAVELIEGNKYVAAKYGVRYSTVDLRGKEKATGIQGPGRDYSIASYDDLLDHYVEIRESKSLTYVWNGIYDADFVKRNSLLFNPRYLYGGEDFDFNYRLIKIEPDIHFSNQVLYLHYKRENHSTAAKYDRNQIDAVYLNMNTEMSLFSEKTKKTQDLIDYIYSKYAVGLLSVFSNKKCTEDYTFVKKQIALFSEKVVKRNFSTIQLMKKVMLGKRRKRYIILFLMRIKAYDIITGYVMKNRRK